MRFAEATQKGLTEALTEARKHSRYGVSIIIDISDRLFPIGSVEAT